DLPGPYAGPPSALNAIAMAFDPVWQGMRTHYISSDFYVDELFLVRSDSHWQWFGNWPDAGLTEKYTKGTVANAIAMAFDPVWQGMRTHYIDDDHHVYELFLVPPPPTLMLSANPSIPAGSAATINWSSTNATSCTATGGWTGAKGTSGSQSTGALTQTTTFTLTCTGGGGSVTKSVTVTVVPAPPTLDMLSANPTTIPTGNSATISRSSTNTTARSATR